MRDGVVFGYGIARIGGQTHQAYLWWPRDRRRRKNETQGDRCHPLH